jgi:hypothetical protein
MAVVGEVGLLFVLDRVETFSEVVAVLYGGLEYFLDVVAVLYGDLELSEVFWRCRRRNRDRSARHRDREQH